MCACEPGFTCSRCADTPGDPHYLELPDERAAGGTAEASEDTD